MKKVYKLEYSVDHVDYDIDYGTRYFKTREMAIEAMKKIAEENFDEEDFGHVVEICDEGDGVFMIDEGFYYADFSIKEYEVEG